MKRVIKKTKFIALALAIAFTLTSNPGKALPTGENPVEIKYLGTIENHPVFLIDLNNTQGMEYTVTLKDPTGKVLFTEKTKEAGFSKKFTLDIDASEFRSPGFALTVEITPAWSKKKETFTISTTTQVIEDVIIAKK